MNAESIWTEFSCQKLLPLFSGEGLRSAVEDCNDTVRYEMRIESVNARLLLRHWPAAVLWRQMQELAVAGVHQLNGKLRGAEDSGQRTVELWAFFFGNVMPVLLFYSDP